MKKLVVAMASKEPRRSQRISQSHMVRIVIAVSLALVWMELTTFSEKHLFLVNRSSSLPHWGFLIARGQAPTRDQILIFTPPPSPFLNAHFGSDSAPFGKIVYGLPGDIVRHEGARVIIGDSLVGVMKDRSLRGEVLVAGPTGKIPPHCYYVGSPHKDGFDSRYLAIGFVCAHQIIGSAVATVL
jgi:conjugal transfer pilin signal peptidase TrbI